MSLINDGKITANLVMATSMAVIGSTFQFGYNTGVINSPQLVIEQFYNATFLNRYSHYISSSSLDLLWGFTVAIFAVGGMVGSLLASVCANKFGLKKSMLYNNAFAITAAFLMGLSQIANSFEMLILGRFVIGLNCGINMGIAPMYLTEISPTKYRGIFGILAQLGIVTSLLLSQILGLQWVLGTESHWGILLGITGLFSIFQIILIPFCVESPRRLLTTDGEVEAIRALMWLRGEGFDYQEEIDEMKADHKADLLQRKASIAELFTTPYLRRPLLIAIVMQLSQQLSGINAVFYYSTQIFLAAGIPQTYTGLATLGIGVINVFMTLVSASLIERAGRRILHLVGLTGMCFCAIALVVFLAVDSITAWLTLIPVFLFVVFFQSGPGAIPWFITAELFSQSSRPSAVSVAGLVNWLGNFTVALAYPSLDAAIGEYSFVIFAALLAIFAAFTFFRVPETKGKTIHEITALFHKDGEIEESSLANEFYYGKGTKL